MSKISKEKFGIEFESIIDVLIGGSIFGIIGARLYYVLFNISKYINSPLHIFAIRDGGLAIYGGLIGIILFIGIYCKIKKIDFLNLVDYMIPYFALGQCIGRWGNFFNIEAYGSETSSIFRMGIETINGYKEVHPVFFYESISTFLIFIFLRKLQKNRKFKGQIISIYFILYGIVRGVLEGIRVDSLMLGNVRISQILSVVFFSVFLIFYIINIKKKTKESK